MTTARPRAVSRSVSIREFIAASSFGFRRISGAGGHPSRTLVATVSGGGPAQSSRVRRRLRSAMGGEDEDEGEHDGDSARGRRAIPRPHPRAPATCSPARIPLPSAPAPGGDGRRAHRLVAGRRVRPCGRAIIRLRHRRGRLGRCVLANRLSADPDCSVFLVEAGGRIATPCSPADADGEAVPFGPLQLALPHRAGGDPRRPLDLLAARQGAGGQLHHQRHGLRAGQPARLRPLGADGPRRVVLRRRAARFPSLRGARPARRRVPRPNGGAHGMPRARHEPALRSLPRSRARGRPSDQRRLQRGGPGGLRALRLHHPPGQALVHLLRVSAARPAPPEPHRRDQRSHLAGAGGARPRDGRGVRPRAAGGSGCAPRGSGS